MGWERERVSGRVGGIPTEGGREGGRAGVVERGSRERGTVEKGGERDREGVHG